MQRSHETMFAIVIFKRCWGQLTDQLRTGVVGELDAPCARQRRTLGPGEPTPKAMY